MLAATPPRLEPRIRWQARSRLEQSRQTVPHTLPQMALRKLRQARVLRKLLLSPRQVRRKMQLEALLARRNLQTAQLAQRNLRLEPRVAPGRSRLVHSMPQVEPHKSELVQQVLQEQPVKRLP